MRRNCMRDQISSHYFVNTDFELAMKLSDQIKDKGIDNFYELEKSLIKCDYLMLVNMTDLKIFY